MGIEGIRSVVGSTYQGSKVAEPMKTIEHTSAQVEGVNASVAGDVLTVEEPSRAFGDGNATAGKDGGETTKSQSEKIKKAVDEINKNAINSEAVFGIHEATNRVTIKIIDKKTREVIKELPPEKTLDMIAKVWEIAGIMVDEKR